jgi:hypothetical protein
VLDEEDEATNQVSAEELKILRQQVDDLEHAVTLVVNRSPSGTSPQLSNNDVTHRLAIDMDGIHPHCLLKAVPKERKRVNFDMPIEFSLLVRIKSLQYLIKLLDV